jgi:hypothetical protein
MMKQRKQKLALMMMTACLIFALGPVRADFTGAPDSGFYAALWGSDIDETFSTELDVYGGWTGDVGPVTLDVGAIQYLFLETNEDNAINNTDYLEIYGGFRLPVS